MKINRKILSIPPHISTSWKRITSLHLQESQSGQTLIVTLENGSIVQIPGLAPQIIELIFLTHTKYLEQDETEEELKESKPKAPLFTPFPFQAEQGFTLSLPMKLTDLDAMGNLGGFLQHDLQKANAPTLPKEIMEKVLMITKAMGLEKQLQTLPKAEPHCNCPFCQISRAIHNEEGSQESKEESFDPDAEVKDEELSFKEWDIKQVGTDLYEVSNPLDKTETYQVFLGKNIGCNCGNCNCEHIKAVLNS